MTEFEWDPAKAAINRRKHGVSFEEASEVFSDAPRVMSDLEHSDVEDRYLAIGFSDRGRMLVVSHVYRDGRVRIISARLATKRDRDWYAKANP